jgi:hypothetical protein
MTGPSRRRGPERRAAHKSPGKGAAEPLGVRFLTERLHSFERQGRPALFVVITHDREGHVLDTTTCDPEDYE